MSARETAPTARVRLFSRKPVLPHHHHHHRHHNTTDQEKGEAGPSAPPHDPTQPRYNSDGHLVNHAGHRVTKGIQPDGESGRRWVNPLKMARICFRSSCEASKWTNLLWPFAIAALVLYFNYPQHQLWIFITAYIGMVPAANLVGFAGQELARKLPKVFGVILETTFGSVVEIILFTVLIVREQRFGDNNRPVIQAAILGSILANLLFCLGLCFFVGGIFHPHQTFHEAISEVGSNLMLVAAVGLVIPSIYYYALLGGATSEQQLRDDALHISHAAAIILLVAFLVYVWFQSRSHHGVYEDILEADEEKDHDRHKDLAKDKLTMTESILAVVIALMFVSFMAVFLVSEIHYIVVERNAVHDLFMGLILIPIVEKAAEHITAIDEAYDNQMNFALAHVLGASIQTALLNTPLAVLIAWGLGVELTLNFELFPAVLLVLAILVVGGFLRDEKSDYLEGALCVFVYLLIAICAYYYPNPEEGETTTAGGHETGSESSSVTSEAVAAATEHVVRMVLGS